MADYILGIDQQTEGTLAAVIDPPAASSAAPAALSRNTARSLAGSSTTPTSCGKAP